MPPLLERYASWLHLRWPAGRVEPLPDLREDGSTGIPGVYVAGDLAGLPLLKFALDSGARVIERIAADLAAERPRDAGPGRGVVDVAILGAGVAGAAAAVEARARGLRYTLIEAAEPFATIANFPRKKPIYTYPMAMTPAGRLQVRADVKEALLDELREQARAASIEIAAGRAERIERKDGTLLVHLAEGAAPVEARRVVIAIGRSGDYRRLGVPGEDLDKVSNRLHDPADFTGKNVLVVGGGDSALEAAIALGKAGARVTVAHRGREFARAKPENAEQVRHAAAIRFETRVKEIARERVVLVDAAS